MITFADSTSRDEFRATAEAMPQILTSIEPVDVVGGGYSLLLGLHPDHRTGNRPTSGIVTWIADAARGLGAESAVRAGSSIQDHVMFPLTQRSVRSVRSRPDGPRSPS